MSRRVKDFFFPFPLLFFFFLAEVLFGIRMNSSSSRSCVTGGRIKFNERDFLTFLSPAVFGSLNYVRDILSLAKSYCNVLY